MHSGHKTFEDVKAWQLGKKFRIDIYQISKRFPVEEKYVLTSQIRRAVISINSNIAEGYGRYFFQENINFCRIARGSANEVLDQLYVALDEKYIRQDEFKDLYNKGRELEKALNGYISFLQNQKSKF